MSFNNVRLSNENEISPYLVNIYMLTFADNLRMNKIKGLRFVIKVSEFFSS